MDPYHQLATAVLDMTPARSLPMGGHGGADRLPHKIHGRLEANILAFGVGANAVVLVSVDTLFIGATLNDQILRACSSRFGVGPERVLVLASHTHTAPMLDAGKPGLGRADHVEIERWANEISLAIQTACGVPATSIRVGLGDSDLAVNRRLRWRMPTLARLLGKAQGDIYICDNPDGPRDRRIRTAVWHAADGQPLAVLWSFACHPTGFPMPATLSADYVGVVREAFRERLGAGVPVVFAPGCMGDVRPPSARPWKTIGRLPRILIYGPQPVPYDLPGWEAWARSLADDVLSVEKTSELRPIAGAQKAAPMVCSPMEAIFDGVSPTKDLRLKAVSLPGFGRIITVSCEPVAEIADLLSPKDSDLVLGYEGDVFGYLPTDAMIAEGGYESSRFMSHFGLSGAFKPGLDARISSLGEALLKGSAFT